MTSGPSGGLPPVALIGAVARLLNAGLSADETIAAIADALRAALPASRVAIWRRDPTGARFQATVSPAMAVDPEQIGSLDELPPPGPGAQRCRIVHDDEVLGLVEVCGDASHGETVRIAADLLGPYASSLELSRDFASEVARRARELEEQRRFTELIIDSLPVGLYVVDRQYRIQVWNRKRETGTQGLSRDAVVGRPVFDVLSRQSQQELTSQLDRVLETGEILQLEQDVPGIDGGRSFRISKIPMRLDGEHISHVITIGEDVTEWRSAQAQIMQSEKLAAIGQLAAGVMHEINNPLATIGACAAALDGLLPPGDPREKSLREYVDIIDKEVQRCSRIVDGLLDFSRPKGKTKTRVDLNRVVEDTLFLLQHHRRFKQLKVERHLAAGLPPVRANAEQLVQVFMALMLNALDAMEHGGELTVSTRLHRGRPDEVTVEIQDTGMGIPRSRLGQIFEPFYTTKPPGRGTGLGLSICYGIVEAHNGRIEAESSLGQGSVFRVFLPVHAGSADA